MELLQAAGYTFALGPYPDVDESVPADCPAVEAALRIAVRKAAAVADVAREGMVLTADTLVVHEDVPLGKPADEAGARAMLRRLSGAAHEVATGVAIAGPDGAGGVRVESGLAVTQVRFRELNDDEIVAYVESGEPLDKAGAYAIQGGAAGFVASIDGPRDNVIGLPMDLVRDLFARFAGLAG